MNAVIEQRDEVGPDRFVALAARRRLASVEW
jgi:hypothetical protein